MNAAWFIERHVKGAFRVTPAADVFERNLDLILRGEPVEWIVIGAAKDMTEARELELQLKRSIKEDRT